MDYQYKSKDGKVVIIEENTTKKDEIKNFNDNKRVINYATKLKNDSKSKK